MPVEDPLIGRQAERGALGALAARARAGHGSIVLIAGEAGVGKTTLARNALAESGLELFEGFGERALNAYLLGRILDTTQARSNVSEEEAERLVYEELHAARRERGAA